VVNPIGSSRADRVDMSVFADPPALDPRRVPFRSMTTFPALGGLTSSWCRMSAARRKLPWPTISTRARPNSKRTASSRTASRMATADGGKASEGVLLTRK
jgi:hypothetical protein